MIHLCLPRTNAAATPSSSSSRRLCDCLCLSRRIDRASLPQWFQKKMAHRPGLLARSHPARMGSRESKETPKGQTEPSIFTNEIRQAGRQADREMTNAKGMIRGRDPPFHATSHHLPNQLASPHTALQPPTSFSLPTNKGVHPPPTTSPSPLTALGDQVPVIPVIEVVPINVQSRRRLGPLGVGAGEQGRINLHGDAHLCLMLWWWLDGWVRG